MSPQQPLHLLEWLSIHQGLLLLLVTYKLFPSSKTPVSFWKFTPHSLCSESLVNPSVYPLVWSGHLRWLFFFFFFFVFWLFPMACRILVPDRGLTSGCPAVEAWSLNHWATREVPWWLFSCSPYIPCLISAFFTYTLCSWLPFLHACPRPQLVILSKGQRGADPSAAFPSN